MPEINSVHAPGPPSGPSPLADLADVRGCFQCQKCSAGCPVAFAMDYKPNQVMEMVSLGMKDRLLACKTIWICASCYTCSARCPNEIDIAGVMDSLRRTALKERAAAAEKDVPLFHAAFLESVRRHGRVHELSLMVRYKMKSHRYFDDMKLGWKLFANGKLRLLPSGVKRKKEVAGLFAIPGPSKRRAS